MIDIRPSCENCNTHLPYNSEEARICAFECTFCKNCVENTLHNVCPNCGGGFEKRPILPKAYLLKYPPKSEPKFRPIDKEKFNQLLDRFKDINPSER